MSYYPIEPPAKILRLYLEKEGLITNEWPGFNQFIPINQTQYVLISDTVGVIYGHVARENNRQVENFGIQFLVASNEYEIAYKKARSLVEWLNENMTFKNFEIPNPEDVGFLSGTICAWILTSPPMLIRVDEKNRGAIVSFNGLLNLKGFR